MVLVTRRIDDALANSVVSKLLCLELQSRVEPVVVLINSEGGQLYAGFAIYDAMRLLSAPVHTLCLGRAESMACVLLAAGEPGKRYVAPNARVMIHQISWTVEGKRHAADVEVEAAEAVTARRRFAAALATCSGKDLAQVEAAMERDNYMGAEEAVAFGIADEVLESVAAVLPTAEEEAALPPPSEVGDIAWNTTLGGWRQFVEKPGAKAFAVASDRAEGGRRAWAAVWAYDSQQDAVRQALERCRINAQGKAGREGSANKDCFVVYPAPAGG